MPFKVYHNIDNEQVGYNFETIRYRGWALVIYLFRKHSLANYQTPYMLKMYLFSQINYWQTYFEQLLSSVKLWVFERSKFKTHFFISKALRKSSLFLVNKIYSIMFPVCLGKHLIKPTELIFQLCNFQTAPKHLPRFNKCGSDAYIKVLHLQPFTNLRERHLIRRTLLPTTPLSSLSAHSRN